MKSPWVTLAAVLLIGLAIGAAIAGRPTTPAHDTRVRSVPTTTEITTTTSPATPPVRSTTTEAIAVTTTSTTTTAVMQPTTTTDPTTTTTTVPGPDRGSMLVLVVNAGSESGIARAEAARLVTLGYSKPMTNDAVGPQKESVVYARVGHDDEGLLLLADAGLSADRLRPFPNPPLTTRDDQVNVILALGIDWHA